MNRRLTTESPSSAQPADGGLTLQPFVDHFNVTRFGLFVAEGARLVVFRRGMNSGLRVRVMNCLVDGQTDIRQEPADGGTVPGLIRSSPGCRDISTRQAATGLENRLLFFRDSVEGESGRLHIE